MKKIKKILTKSKGKFIIGIIIGGLIFGTIGVYAATYFPSVDVTYDNKESGLVSTDVQGAIDELYNKCSSVISSGNYLYYTEPSDGIFKMDLSTGSSSRVGSYGLNPTSIFVKNNYIYYSNYNGIYRMTINGTEQTRLNNTYKNVYHLNVTDDYIYFLYAYSNSYQYIYRMPLNGGTPKNIKELYGNYINVDMQIY